MVARAFCYTLLMMNTGNPSESLSIAPVGRVDTEGCPASVFLRPRREPKGCATKVARGGVLNTNHNYLRNRGKDFYIEDTYGFRWKH